MTKFLAVVIVILALVAIAQLAKVYDFTRELRGKREEDISPRDNRMNAGMMIVFMIVFFATSIYQMIFFGSPLPEAASEHGVQLDNLLNFNWYIVVAVFFLCNALLFIFSAKYYYRENRKAFYYPHNNKLELLWTIVPAGVLGIIIIYGLSVWQNITSQEDRDQNALEIELYAQQFAWNARYGGADNKLGDVNYLMVSSNNALGLITQSAIDSQLNANELGYNDRIALLEAELAYNDRYDAANATIENIDLALHKIETYLLPKNEHALAEMIENHKHHGGHADHEGDADDAHHGDDHGDGHDEGHAAGGHGHGHDAVHVEEIGDIDKYLDIFFANPEGGVQELKAKQAEARAQLRPHSQTDRLYSGLSLAQKRAELEKLKILRGRIVGMDARFKANGYKPGYDDIVVDGTFYIPVNREVKFSMRSKDVIHSAYMPHFRAQMNCVPGMTTPFRLKPTITTEEMKNRLNDPNFEYTLLCNKICGSNHYNMMMTIKVVTEEEYQRWIESKEVFDPAMAGVKTTPEEETVTVAEVNAANGQ